MELRGSTFHPPTLDMLDEFGVVPRMIEVGLKAPTWQFRDRETGPVATFDLSLLAGDTNHPYRVQCEQWKLMRLPRRRAGQVPGRRHPVRPQGDGGAAGRRRRDGDGRYAAGPVSSTGRYVVAADGARSAVRRSLGIEFEGFTYPELFLIASTDFPFEDTLTDIAYVNYIADPNEWLVLLRVPGLWRVLVPAPENADREKLLSDEILQAVLQRVVPRAEPYADRAPLDLSRASAGGEELPPRPRAARRRCRAHQQSARRHGHERRHPGRVQPRRQARGRSGPAPTIACSTATSASAAPSRSRRCSSRPTATSRSSASATRRHARRSLDAMRQDRGGQEALRANTCSGRR